jgi:hypothetical protein
MGVSQALYLVRYVIGKLASLSPKTPCTDLDLDFGTDLVLPDKEGEQVTEWLFHETTKPQLLVRPRCQRGGT